MKGIDYYPILHGGNIPKKLINFPFCGGTYLKKSTAVICPSHYLKKAVKKKFDIKTIIIQIIFR